MRYGVISDVRIELDPGLNCFTGATGAGKSLVIGAVEVLLGLRSPAEMLRPGADEGRVSGVFEIRNPELLTAPYMSREAVLSSRIEGTQTTMSDVYAADLDQQELVRSPDQLRPALDRAFASGKPALVNVLTDPEVVYPRRANLA